MVQVIPRRRVAVEYGGVRFVECVESEPRKKGRNADEPCKYRFLTSATEEGMLRVFETDAP